MPSVQQRGACTDAVAAAAHTFVAAGKQRRRSDTA
jgi:hypothetical protein